MHIWNSFNCSYSGSGCAESWLWNEYKNRFQIYADLWDWLLLWLGVSRPGIYLSIVKETYDIEWTARKCDDNVSGWLWISSNSSCDLWPQVFPVRDMPRYLKFHWLANLLTHSAVCTRWEWLLRHYITFSIVCLCLHIEVSDQSSIYGLILSGLRCFLFRLYLVASSFNQVDGQVPHCILPKAQGGWVAGTVHSDFVEI